MVVILIIKKMHIVFNESFLSLPTMSLCYTKFDDEEY